MQYIEDVLRESLFKTVRYTNEVHGVHYIRDVLRDSHSKTLRNRHEHA